MIFSNQQFFKKSVFKYWIPLFLIFLLIFSLLFSKKINGILIIIISCFWLLGGDYKSKWEKIKESKIVFLVLFYLVNILGLIYSSNLSTGLNILVKRSSLLLLPLVFVYFIQDKKLADKMKTVYMLACFVAVTYSLVAISYWTLTKNEAFLAEFNRFYIYNYYREILCIPLEIHPTYFSIFLLFGVFLFLERLLLDYLKHRFIYAIGYFFISLYLLIFCFFLASRMPIIAFFVVFLLTIFAWVIKKRCFLITLIILLFLGIGFYKAYNHPILNQRFLEIKQTPLEPPKGIHYNSTNIRIGIIICTIEGIKNNLIFGTGTGDMQDVLNACYAAKDFSPVLYEFRYNTHNLFLDAQLMLGLLGLGSLLLMLYFGFKMAFKTKNYIYVIFLLFWCICGVSESLLNTQKGIVFFSVFNTLLYISSVRSLKNKQEIQYEGLPASV